MRLVRSAIATATIIAGLSIAVLPAHAADYPWCYIDQTISGATYCAFETLAQCRENAGGNGGTCIQNPDYHGNAGQGAEPAAIAHAKRPRR